jgi:hypothetical protein
MIDPQPHRRRLHTRSEASRGLVVDSDGVAFGASCALVHRLTDGSYRVVHKTALAQAVGGAGHGEDIPTLRQRLSRIADALDQGNLVRAQLLGLQLPLAGETPSADSGLIKAGFNDQESRNAAGEWTIGGATAAAVVEGMGFAEAEGSAIATVARTVLAGAARTAVAGAAGIAGGAAGLVAGLVYPSAKWNTYKGTLADHPDVDYRYDEGELSLYRTGADGKPALIYQSRAGEDGFYRDAQGNVIGRDLGGGFKVDADLVRVVPSEAARAFVAARAAAATDEPQVCPDPGLDWPHSASPRAIAYQWQITALPIGVAVTLNGQVYDGCDQKTGNLLEAKGPGYERLMRNSFLRNIIIKQFDNLAQRESEAAGGRIVEWHFAEASVADWAREHFREKGFNNIVVIHTPPIVTLHSLEKMARQHVFFI